MNPSNEKAAELLGEVGRKLKAAREAKGIGLGELSANTRINRGHLEHIEAGELDGLPAITFVRGFVRNYAIAVGLDPNDVMAQMSEVVQFLDSGPMPLDPPAEVRPEPIVTISIPRVALIGAVAVLAVWGGYLLLQISPGPEEEAEFAVSEELASELERRSENLRPGYSPSGGEAEAPGEPSAAAVPPAVTRPLPVETPKQLQLTLRGLESSWVRLSVDRREPVDVYLEPAETAAWAANEEFRLTVGKSHGVSIYLNGEEILLPQQPNMLIPDIVLNKLTLLKLEN